MIYTDYCKGFTQCEIKYALVCCMQEAGDRVKQTSLLNSGVFHAQQIVFLQQLGDTAFCCSSCYLFEMGKGINQQSLSWIIPRM